MKVKYYEKLRNRSRWRELVNMLFVCSRLRDYRNKFSTYPVANDSLILRYQVNSCLK